MKTFLIKLVVFPPGLALVSIACMIALMLLHLPVLTTAANDSNDDFPGQREGGGTHWQLTRDNLA